MKYNSEAYTKSVLKALNQLLPGQLLVTCARDEDSGSPVLCIFQKPSESIRIMTVSLDAKDAESLLPHIKRFIALATPPTSSN